MKKDKNSDLPGYPIYPPEEDIYSQGIEETYIDIEEPKNEISKKLGEMNEKSFKEDMTGDDLDVPGSEDDDLQEEIGNEDEENNYYSLGGDNYENLDEDNQ